MKTTFKVSTFSLNDYKTTFEELTHGRANNTKDKLNVRKDYTHSKSDQNNTQGYKVEPCRWYVVCYQLSRPNTLVGLKTKKYSKLKLKMYRFRDVKYIFT